MAPPAVAGVGGPAGAGGADAGAAGADGGAVGVEASSAETPADKPSGRPPHVAGPATLTMLLAP